MRQNEIYILNLRKMKVMRYRVIGMKDLSFWSLMPLGEATTKFKLSVSISPIASALENINLLLLVQQHRFNEYSESWGDHSCCCVF
jgi:hypothetical protein